MFVNLFSEWKYWKLSSQCRFEGALAFISKVTKPTIGRMNRMKTRNGTFSFTSTQQYENMCWQSRVCSKSVVLCDLWSPCSPGFLSWPSIWDKNTSYCYFRHGGKGNIYLTTWPVKWNYVTSNSEWPGIHRTKWNNSVSSSKSVHAKEALVRTKSQLHDDWVWPFMSVRRRRPWSTDQRERESRDIHWPCFWSRITKSTIVSRRF